MVVSIESGSIGSWEEEQEKEKNEAKEEEWK